MSQGGIGIPIRLGLQQSGMSRLLWAHIIATNSAKKLNKTLRTFILFQFVLTKLLNKTEVNFVQTFLYIRVTTINLSWRKQIQLFKQRNIFETAIKPIKSMKMKTLSKHLKLEYFKHFEILFKKNDVCFIAKFCSVFFQEVVSVDSQICNCKNKINRDNKIHLQFSQKREMYRDSSFIIINSFLFIKK